MKKKLLIVHSFYRDFGGEDANINEEIKFFSKQYEVRFFSKDNKKKLNFIDIFSFVIRKNLNTDKEFKRVLLDFDPDIAYIHNTWFKINLGIFRILKKNNINTILKIHNFRYDCAKYFLSKNHLNGASLCNACNFKKKKYQFFNKYYDDSLLKSIFLIFYSKKYFNILKSKQFKIISISNFQKDKLVKSGINSSSIRVINNPLNFENLFEEVEAKKIVLYAGRVSKEKGLDKLIQAWNSSQLTDYKLYIVGDGPQKKLLQNKYKSKNIKFFGTLSNNEVLNLINQSKAIVTATTLFEGQPRLLCEASFLGKVSIFPEFGGMSEFFPSEYPYSFKQFDYEDLTKKLNLIKNEKLLNQHSKAVKSYIYEKLDENTIFNKFKKVTEIKN